MAKCIACKENAQNRPGGLCYGCYLDKYREQMPGPGIDDEAALMKWVIDGAPCTTDVQKKYKADWNKNPRAFVAQYKELTGKTESPDRQSATVLPLVRDGKTPCPLCKQIVYPEDKGTARLLAETQLKDIPNVIAERPVLLARIAELEKEAADRLAKDVMMAEAILAHEVSQ